MKVYIFLLVISQIILPQSKQYSITELRGMEDIQSNTHLFYRLYYNYQTTNSGETSNSIYHYDLNTGYDTLFLYSGSVWNPLYINTVIINDYKFIHNDPAMVFYLGASGGDPDLSAFIGYINSKTRWEKDISLGVGYNIQVSNQNDSLLYANVSGGFFKSTDGGMNWFSADSSRNVIRLVSLSPFNDQVIFGINKNNYIVKSSDGCKTFTQVDTNSSWGSNITPSFFFDKDSLHIYGLSETYNSYFLSVSTNKGDANSWSVKYLNTNNIFLTADYSSSGTIYLADRNNILISNNYGNTFNVYRSLDSAIVGIYKKPNSDIIYAATKYDIYEIGSSSIKSIKHIILSVDNKGNNIPTEFKLYQNYPNPFNPTTTIKYQIPNSSLVQLKVYDILGREVAMLVNEVQTAGEHLIEFNTQRTTNNKQLSSGVYFYQIRAGSYISTKKMLLLK